VKEVLLVVKIFIDIIFFLFITYRYFIFVVLILKLNIMDAKITLSFDQEVIQRAKAFAESQNVSLSRLMEFMLRRATSGSYQQLEDLPIADWVQEVSEGKAEYITRPKSRKSLKKEFFDSRK
jgi:hypothetical protein